MSFVVNEVIRPNMIFKDRPMTNTEAFIKPQATPFRLVLRHFKSLHTPDSLNSFMIHAPAFLIKKYGYSSITIAPIFISLLLEIVSDFSGPNFGVQINTIQQAFSIIKCLINRDFISDQSIFLSHLIFRSSITSSSIVEQSGMAPLLLTQSQ